MIRIIHSCLIMMLLAGTSCFLSTASAQIPRQISYQGLIIDAGGKPAVDGNHTLEVNIYDAATSTIAIHTETFLTTTKAGVFNIALGSVNSFPASMVFDRQYWLGVSIDGQPELSPRTALLSAPYALNAGTAQLAHGVTGDAKGVVTSLNEIDGAVRIIGDSVIGVSQSGSVITLSAKIPEIKGIPFNLITSGTNKGQQLIVGDSSTLRPVGTGNIFANKLIGSTIDASSYAGRIKIPKGASQLTVNLAPTVGCTPNSSVTVSQFDQAGNEILVGTMVTQVNLNTFSVEFSAGYPTDTGYITYLVVNP